MPLLYAILVVLFVIAIGINAVVARLVRLDDARRN
jgi:hypothetical protein